MGAKRQIEVDVLKLSADAIAAGNDVKRGKGRVVEIDARAGVAQERTVPIDIERVVAPLAVVEGIETDRKRLVGPGTDGAGGRDAVFIEREWHATCAVYAGLDQGNGKPVGAVEVEAAAADACAAGGHAEVEIDNYVAEILRIDGGKGRGIVGPLESPDGCEFFQAQELPGGKGIWAGFERRRHRVGMAREPGEISAFPGRRRARRVEILGEVQSSRWRRAVFQPFQFQMTPARNPAMSISAEHDRPLCCRVRGRVPPSAEERPYQLQQFPDERGDM